MAALPTGSSYKKSRYAMFESRVKLILIFPAFIIIPLLLFRCSTSKFTEDAFIQQDITGAVNNYNSESWETRLASLQRVSKYSNTVYAKNTLLLVMLALDDTHSEVRIEALKILKSMKAQAAMEKIGKIALEDGNTNVRYYAFSALEEYGDRQNEDIFINGFDDRDWLVREAALKGLMNIDDPDIQKKYLDVILNAINDENISIKITAISNIKVKDPAIYEELADIINNRESRLSILKAALEKIKGYKLDSSTRKRIIELLTHRNKNIRILSLQVLKHEESGTDI